MALFYRAAEATRWVVKKIVVVFKHTKVMALDVQQQCMMLCELQLFVSAAAAYVHLLLQAGSVMA
jgi:hypothetical protein